MAAFARDSNAQSVFHRGGGGGMSGDLAQGQDPLCRRGGAIRRKVHSGRMRVFIARPRSGGETCKTSRAKAQFVALAIGTAESRALPNNAYFFRLGFVRELPG